MKNYLITLLLSLVFLAGCGDASSPTRPNTFTPLTAVEITSVNPQIANLTSNQFTATGNFSGQFPRDITADASWSSSDETIATVSNLAETIGRATGVSPGSTSIVATLDGISGSFPLSVTNARISSIDISPLAPTTPKGLTTQFQASGNFSDATTQDISFDVSWSSSDTTAVTISNLVGSKGLASTVEVGFSNISATFDGTTASTQMEVSDAILQTITLSPLEPSILTLSSGQFAATGTFSDATTLDLTDQATWASSLPTIASISDTAGTKGLVSTLLEGSTTISASRSGVQGSTSLSVTGGDLLDIAVLPGNSTAIHITPVIPLEMTAEGDFTNGSRNISDLVTWSSSNQNVATIDSQGIVTTVDDGVTTISAVNGTITGETQLTVTTATFTAGTLTVTPESTAQPTIALNSSQKFTASGDFSDGTTRDLTAEVTWSSSDPAVATDPDEGVATGLAAGTTSIAADFKTDTATSSLDVTAPTLLSVTIEPQGGTILPGESLQLTATAAYSGNPPTLTMLLVPREKSSG